MSNSMQLEPHLTGDGSYTFFSSEYGEAFHSSSGAREEAEKKFVRSCRIAPKAKEQQKIKLLDICYGLGYNSAAALATIGKVNPHCQVELIALEIDEVVAKNAIAQGLLEHWPFFDPQILPTLVEKKQVATPNLQGKLLIGDARQTLQQVYLEGFQADAIFLDPFSPTKCPQLWSVEFLNLVAQCLAPTGYLATYSCAASVRTALKMAGLSIGATESVGRRSPGTIASWSSKNLPPLSVREYEHLQTSAAIPYRDPLLTDHAGRIRQRRQEEQRVSLLEPSSHWKKRWASLRENTDFCENKSEPE